jgi:hypothetical protein
MRRDQTAEGVRLDALMTAMGERLGIQMRDLLAPLERRVAALERDRSGDGHRRRFTSVEPDPNAPGCTRLGLDDGSYVSLPDERLVALAGIRAEGRA